MALPIADIIARHWDPPLLLIAKLAAIIALVLLNGFFVAAEFALVKIRGSQIDTLAAEGSKRATFAKQVKDNLNAYLSACQVGITAASLGLGWLGEPFLARMLQPFFAFAEIESPAVIKSVSFTLAFSVITFLHIVLGEQAPKILAIRKATPAALFVSGPLRLFYTIFKPAIWFLNAASNWVLRHLLRIEPVGRRGAGPQRRGIAVNICRECEVCGGNTSWPRARYQCARPARPRRARYHDATRRNRLSRSRGRLRDEREQSDRVPAHAFSALSREPRQHRRPYPHQGTAADDARSALRIC